MHELSIVEALINQCEELVKSNSAKKVISVEVKVGVLSGIEPHFFQTTFDTFKKETVCHNAKLVMNMQKVVVTCKACKTQSTLEKNHFVCPKCQNEDITVQDGEELMLMRLEME